MSKKVYNADYFIKKFSEVPSKQWCRGVYTNHRGQHCAQGHCGIGYSSPGSVIAESTEEGLALRYLFERYSGLRVSHVNDGSVETRRLFPNKTIKGRVLAALEVIKLMQEAGLDPEKEAWS